MNLNVKEEKGPKVPAATQISISRAMQLQALSNEVGIKQSRLIRAAVYAMLDDHVEKHPMKIDMSAFPADQQ